MHQPEQPKQPKLKQVSDISSALQRGRRRPQSAGCGDAIFLIGAGCSKSAGVPLGREIAESCAIELARSYSNGDFEPPSADEALAWLIKQKRFEESVTWANAYGYIFEEHYADPLRQQEIVRQSVAKAPGVNWAHLCLGELVEKGYVHTVLTTNFDQFVLEGIIRTGVIPVVADGIESLNRIDGRPQHPQVVHLHGSLHTYNPRNSSTSVLEPKSDLSTGAALFSLLQKSGLLVIVGYAGGEEAVMDLLIQSAMRLPDKAIFWVMHSANPESLSSRGHDLLALSRNSAIIVDQDADDFFRHIMKDLGLGRPEWMKTPVQCLKQQAGRIVTPLNAAISAEVEIYHKTLNLLERLLTQEESGPLSPEKAIAIARQLQLAGNLSAALEILRPLASNQKSVEVWTSQGEIALELGKDDLHHGRLQEAIRAFSAALDLCNRDTSPGEWADLQSKLGKALATLGEREKGTKKLEEAVKAYRAALEVRQRESMRLEWATTQHNLGSALRAIGQRQKGTKRLEEAVKAYRAVLEVRTRDLVPLDWALTQNSLGTALWVLGERETGTEHLEEAIQAFRAALEVYRRELVPLDWAMVQSNLGSALLELGKKGHGTTQLEEAIVAFRAALEIYTRERLPRDWAMVQHNLGGTLHVLGERENSTERLEQALQANRAALEVYTRSDDPLNWALTQHQLGNTLLALGKKEPGVVRLEEAVKAYRLALEEAKEGFYADRFQKDLENGQKILRESLVS